MRVFKIWACTDMRLKCSLVNFRVRFLFLLMPVEAYEATAKLLHVGLLHFAHSTQD